LICRLAEKEEEFRLFRKQHRASVRDQKGKIDESKSRYITSMQQKGNGGTQWFTLLCHNFNK